MMDHAQILEPGPAESLVRCSTKLIELGSEVDAAIQGQYRINIYMTNFLRGMLQDIQESNIFSCKFD